MINDISGISVKRLFLLSDTTSKTYFKLLKRLSHTKLQCKVVGTAIYPEVSEAYFDKLAPDIIIVVITENMRFFNQAHVTEMLYSLRSLHELSPRTKILAVTYKNYFALTLAFLQAGANGYIYHHELPGLLQRRIDHIIADKGEIDRNFAYHFRIYIQENDISYYFNERENQVLNHLSHGATTDAIGKTLNIHERVVKNHIGNILLKIQDIPEMLAQSQPYSLQTYPRAGGIHIPRNVFQSIYSNYRRKSPRIPLLALSILFTHFFLSYFPLNKQIYHETLLFLCFKMLM
jgi:DNA-binding NarL/FixJ family response regulator